MAAADQNTPTQTKRKKKPPARSGHIAVCAGEYMLVWGGYSDRVRKHPLPDSSHNAIMIYSCKNLIMIEEV